MSLPQKSSDAILILDRVFHFTVLLPFLHLDGRLGRNVLIDPIFNDACLAAADIAVSAFHFTEQARHTDPTAAKILRNHKDFHLLADIANSRKHYLRGDPKKQISLIGRLLYEKDDELGFAFIETEIIAVTSKQVEHNVADILLSYINTYREYRAGGASTRLIAPPRPRSAFFPEARMAFSFETFSIGASSMRLVRRAPDGTYVAAASGEEISFALEQRLENNTTIGRWQIQNAVNNVEDWFDSIDHEIERTDKSLPPAYS